ncbi:type I-G CRISPR-associated protein, Cas3-extension family [Prosthecobacter dejongeii]|uniref:Uncharacterized protein n=1 Tax=Prosthecobacter dejongeii TaxID=48465 RepID=A0A7W8DQR1_9BACT|nr:hypothetical protein [Prosthecobacter dejongeii]MBB5038166.1 hypothetical protein [Prosthecobacter dejongeii]
MSTHTLQLIGLKGSNSVGYLAALGTLRLLAHHHPDWKPKLSWDLRTEKARLHTSHPLTKAELVESLHTALIGGPTDPSAGLTARELLRTRIEQIEVSLKQAEKDKSLTKTDLKDRKVAFNSEITKLRVRWLEHAAPHLNYGPDTKFKAPEWRAWELQAQATAHEQSFHAATLAALCSSACEDDEGLAEDTAFRTVRGAGHQHFLGIMANQLLSLAPEHITKTLFAPWVYDDPTESLSLRLDPLDDVRYALRWRNPSGDPERKKQGGMIGANALAVTGLALHPVHPRQSGLRTTGFTDIDKATTWTWPLWDIPIDIATTRSLIALAESQEDKPDHCQLSPRGVFRLYRCERFTQGKFRNFTPATAV